ncbi:MAG: AbrB/MazE/SpoVT family DNA-binding domain-containing protein [Propionibacteriaceae bacterium]|nr:AbrB/MazE/SpoVT family DNA-binding domain-containing protein [Propionibacteriaceae bacterium]
MSIMYATVTSKGQVTLPAELRRLLGIQPGQTIGFRTDGQRVTVETSTSVEDVRTTLEEATRQNGTWGQTSSTPPAWRATAVERYANS